MTFNNKMFPYEQGQFMVALVRMGSTLKTYQFHTLTL
jgi:hypothetical protein